MKLKITDIERIKRRICEKKGCDLKAEAIFKTKYLCYGCFEEERPRKATTYIKIWKKLFG